MTIVALIVGTAKAIENFSYHIVGKNVVFVLLKQ